MTAPNLPARMPPPLGDDYDRMGCTAEIEVGQYGYMLRILWRGSVFESYRTVKTPEEVARMLQDWLEGKVPRPPTQFTQVSESGS